MTRYLPRRVAPVTVRPCRASTGGANVRMTLRDPISTRSIVLPAACSVRNRARPSTSGSSGTRSVSLSGLEFALRQAHEAPRGDHGPRPVEEEEPPVAAHESGHAEHRRAHEVQDEVAGRGGRGL